jgi:hypothetical protein
MGVVVVTAGAQAVAASSATMSGSDGKRETPRRAPGFCAGVEFITDSLVRAMGEVKPADLIQWIGNRRVTWLTA